MERKKWLTVLGGCAIFFILWGLIKSVIPFIVIGIAIYAALKAVSAK